MLILFDFDGTLVDTSQDLLKAVNYTRKQLQLGPLTFDQAKKHIGIGQSYLVDNVTADAPQRDLDAILKIFRDYYSQHMHDHSAFYPGIIELLPKIKEHKLGIVSNKYSYYIKDILPKLNCPIIFDIIIGPDSLPARKPDPAPLIHASKALNIPLAQTIMIGDSHYDIQAGKAAGVKTIGVTYGFSSPEEICIEAPDYIVDAPNKILDIIANVSFNSNR
jgi:phosphoglycolate phosphatase